MKNLVKVAKVAFMGYCAYKLIDAAVDNRKKTKQPEEYIPFDEIPVEEPKKKDNNEIKKTIIIAGGIALTHAICKRIDTLEKIVDHNFDIVNDRITLNTAFATAGYYTENNVEKIAALIDLKHRFSNRPEVVAYIEEMLKNAEVK